MAETYTRRIDVRIDEATYRQLEAIKRCGRWKTSEAVRAAIEAYAAALDVQRADRQEHDDED